MTTDQNKCPSARIPKLDDEQRSRALIAARKARTMRAALKREIADGSLTVSAALDRPEAQRIRVRDLIQSVYGIGPAKADKIMVEIGVADNRRVGGLGSRQRELLRSYFG